MKSTNKSKSVNYRKLALDIISEASQRKNTVFSRCEFKTAKNIVSFLQEIFPLFLVLSPRSMNRRVTLDHFN